MRLFFLFIATCYIAAASAQTTDTAFYANGRIEWICNFDTLWEQPSGLMRVYDSTTGYLAEKGQVRPSRGRTGGWKVYRNGKYLRTDHYHYNIIRDSLFDVGGNRLLLYFTYGFGAGYFINCKDEHFKMRYVPIAGCVVSKEIVRRAAIHNFCNDVLQGFRLGWKWRRRYNAYKCE